VAQEPQNAFTDYIKSRQNQPGGIGFAPDFGAASVPGEGTNRGWLAKIIDVVNVGVYPMVNQANAFLDLPDRVDEIRSNFAQGNTGEGWKNVGSTVFNTLPPVNFAKGLSTVGKSLAGRPVPEEERMTFEGVVERTSDVINRNNPDYVDFEDNVNPILKAGVGLTLDIVADPLTWLTAGALGAGKLATRGGAAVASASAKAGNQLSDAARSATTATEAVVGAERIPGIRSIPSLQSNLSPALRLTDDAGQPTRFAQAPKGSSLEALQSYGNRFTTYMAKMEGTAAGITTRQGVDALPVAKPASAVLGGTDNLPASTLTQELSETLARSAPTGKSASDEVLKTIRETIDKKTVLLPSGSRTSLRGGLAGLFKTLAKPTAATAQAAKLRVLSPEPFARKLREDLTAPALANTRLGALLPNIDFSIPGRPNARIAPTVGKALEQYVKASRDGATEIQEAIANKVLRPLLEKYNAAVTAGKNVNALGLPANASAAAAQAVDDSAAAIIATNLKNLDAANKERAIALFGDDFFEIMSNMEMRELMPLIDDMMLLTRKSGVIDDISLLTRTEATSAFLKLFNIDAAMLNAAKADVDARLLQVDGITPEGLARNIENISQAPGVKDDALDFLIESGFDINRYSADEIDELGKALDKVFEQGIKPALLRTFDDSFRQSNGYKIFTDEGVARTAEEFAEGLGIVPNIVNTHTLMDIWINIGKVSKQFFEGGGGTLKAFRGLEGTQRAAAKENFDLALMRTVENFLDSKGIPITMDWRIAKNGSSITRSLRFTEAFSNVKAAIVARGLSKDWMRLLFSNAGTGVAASKFMDGIMTALTGGNVDDVIAVLKSAERRNKFRSADSDLAGVPKSSGQISNWLAEPGEWGRFGTFTAAQAKNFKDTDLIKKGAKTVKGGTERLFNKEAAARILAEAIVEAAPSLSAKATMNSKALVARGIAEGEAVGDVAAKIISGILYDSTRYAEALRVVSKSGQVVKDVANTIGNVSPLGASIANAKVSLALGVNVKNSALTTTELAAAVGRGNPEEIARATEKYYSQIDDIIRDIDNATYKVMDDLLAGRVQLTDPKAQRLLDNQMAQIIDTANDGFKGVMAGGFASIRAAIFKGLDPVDQFFNARRGMRPEDQLFVSQLYQGTESLQGHFQSKYLLPINQLGLKYNGWVDGTTTILQQAFNNIRQGIKGSGVVGQAQEEMAPYIARLFGGSDDPANALLGNIFLRTGTQLERVNDILSQKKVLETTAEGLTRGPDEYFDLALAAERLGPNPKRSDVMAEAASQWRTWDIKDPIQFLDRMYKAAAQLTAEAGYVNKFVQEGIALDVVSKTPVKGFIKIGPKSEGVITKHLTRDIYVHPEVLDAFKATDEMVEGSTGIFKVPFGGKLDEFTDATKYAMTQARLGHHVRNYVGGLTMSHMAMGAVHYGKSHKDAIRLLSTIRNNDEYDLVAAMTAMDIPLRSTQRNASKAAEVLYTSRKTGKSVTTEQVIDAANRLGIFPKVRSAEAFATSGEAQGRVGRWTQKFLTFASLGLAARGGRMEKFWSTISEAQDHTNRLHLFLQYTYQALDGKAMTRGFGKVIKPKDLEDIFFFAAERVQKFHPTSAVLTRLEKAIPRRLFPFYAWNKGAVIALSEAISMAPGRVNLPGKISYNLGVATGVDPNSMYDPFPQDQQFPSWLVEDIAGPQFKLNGQYYGAAPGIAQWDILNQFGASDSAFDPIRQVFVDSLNPAFKLPIEAISERRLSTKGPITDVSDYVDSSIPTVGYIANLSTYSPSSILIDGELQRQAKVESGVKTGEDRLLTAVNWLTGFGVYNASRPDYIRSAQIERQQRLAEEREKGQ
jgi:hypothetical protein